MWGGGGCVEYGEVWGMLEGVSAFLFLFVEVEYW